MVAIAELYSLLHLGSYHESKWSIVRRHDELPWHHPYHIPYFRGDDKHCRHPDCPETNWGGLDRLHMRSVECPPLPDYIGRHRDDADTSYHAR